MGNQQLLLLILGTIVVGIAVAVGITEFRSYYDEAIGDEIQTQLVAIAADAREYFEKPTSLGGGGRSFKGYSAPSRFARTQHGLYSLGHTRYGEGIFIVGYAMSMDDQITLNLMYDETFQVLWEAKGKFADRNQTEYSPL